MPSFLSLLDIWRTLRRPAHSCGYAGDLFFHLRTVVNLPETSALALGAIAAVLYCRGADGSAASPQALATELWREFGPQSSTPMISEITSSAAEPAGVGREATPDLLVQFRPGVIANCDPLADRWISRPNYRRRGPQHLGTHTPEGVLVIHGPDVRRGVVAHADIVDILPTVLAYLGVPIPAHVDGRVLQKPFLYMTSPARQKGEFQNTADEEPASYSSEEQMHIEQHLANLGYL